MIEVILLVRFCKRVGEIVRPKGYSVVGFRLLMVVAWFGGEIVGGIFGAIVSGVRGEGSPTSMAPVYICALIGAALGAMTVFSIANRLGARELPSPEPAKSPPYAPQLPPSARRPETGNPYQPPSSSRA